MVISNLHLLLYEEALYAKEIQYAQTQHRRQNPYD